MEEQIQFIGSLSAGKTIFRQGNTGTDIFLVREKYGSSSRWDRHDRPWPL
jgi:hypothetical protein